MTQQEYGIPGKAARSWFHRAAPAIPYAAVGIGMYGFSSAWAAVLLYQAGMLALILTRDSRVGSCFSGWDNRWAVAMITMGALAGEGNLSALALAGT